MASGPRRVERPVSEGRAGCVRGVVVIRATNGRNERSERFALRGGGPQEPRRPFGSVLHRLRAGHTSQADHGVKREAEPLRQSKALLE